MRIRQTGYTLVELMVALAVGLLVVASLTIVYVNSSLTRNEIEKTSQQNENGRYAIQLLSDDLRNAGYLAGFNHDPFPDRSFKDAKILLLTPTTKPDPCATDLPSLKAALPLAVQGYNNGISPMLSCLNDVKTGTDILVVRRVSTCAVGAPNCDAAVAGAPYFQTSGCNSNAELSFGDISKIYALETDTSKLQLHQQDCSTLAPLYQYRVHIYFVANNDKNGDNIPTLKRAELDLTTLTGWTIVPLVEGIENLHLEYGIDGVDTTTGSTAGNLIPPTGAPAVFTANPDTYKSCSGASPVGRCIAYWRNTVAAKVYVLARNTVATGGFKDQKSYTLGLQADGTTLNTVAAANDAYKRHVFETVVRLNNTAGRNTP